MKHLIKRSIQLLALAVGILFSTHSVHAQYPYYQQTLLNERVGFAANATGGAGGEVYWVTSLAEYGSGTLREAAEGTTPRWIRFAVSGTINLGYPISVASNKTIDGRGASITITGMGFWVIGSRNIIVENLNFSQGSNPYIDGIEITEGAGDVWVDHCSFSGLPDEDISVKEPRPPALSDVTISWCRFIGSPYQDDKGVLIGHEPGHTDGHYMRVTLHHNWFDVDQRSPRIRRALVHAFNNYVNNWTYHGMASSDYGQLRTDNNIFHAGSDKDAVLYQGSPEANGYTKNVNNWKLNGAITYEYNPANPPYNPLNQPYGVFDPATYYTYSHVLETALNNSALRTKIQTFSGATRSGSGFANMSTRAHVQSGQGVLISGMYIGGPAGTTKKVVIRAIGPSLAPWIPGAMGNTTLRVYNSAGQEIKYNDNWGDTQYAELQASGLAPSHSLEAAVLLYLTPGSYSAVIDGWGTGIASVEVYDADPSAPSKLLNISSRATVDPSNPPIAGLICHEGLTRIILRGIGPSLANHGIQGPISDPTLTLHNANGTQIAFNSNWQDTQSAEIQQTGLQPSDWRESAILIDLPGGSYTAVLRDYWNAWGIGSIEAYKL